MLAQPVMFACILSSGSTWSMPSILPPVGDSWPTGGSASAYAVFTDTAGDILATIDGAISATAVDFVGIAHTSVDAIPAGANCEIFITDTDGNPYKIRYGRVVRREVTFPNAPTQVTSEQPLTFVDNLQRTALGSNWVALVGTTQQFLNAAINDVQTVGVGSATAGTFALTFNGQTTGAIAYNASAATVQSALQALSTVGSGNVTVSGSQPSWTVTFAGELAGAPQNPMTIAGTGLTGGTASVTHTTTGMPATYGTGSPNELLTSTPAAIRYVQPLNTDTVSVNVNLMNQGAGVTAIVLCADINLTTGLAVEFDSSNNEVYTAILDSGAPGTVTVATEGSPAADTVAAEPDNYTVAYNNATGELAVYKGDSTMPLVTWTDTDQVVPHGAGYRYVGLCWNNDPLTNGVQVSSWSAQDTI